MNGKLLIIDDDVDVLSAAKLLLKRHFQQVDIEKNPEKLPFLITNGHYDVVLLDMNFTRDVNTGNEGFHWLDKILDIDNQAVVVLFTAYGDVEMAVRAIKLGATDFILKPWENDKLLATLHAAFEIRQQKTGSGDFTRKSQSQSAQKDIIAHSAVLKKILETVEKIAPTDANVLITGENGTGKDVLARLIHARSARHDAAFVAADLGALPESLFESELFGHVKGAFTDARADRTGKFEEANGGTIFLDEIGNVSPMMQAKLLSVLQQRTVTKVGSNKPKAVDVRLICATNADVAQMVAQRQFRQDLLYRINTIEIHLPALRERPDDIEPLAEHFLKIYRKKYNRSVNSLSAALVKQLQRHNWPGNVRELQHAVERAVIMTQNTTLQPEDFFLTNANNTDNSAFENTFQLDEIEKQTVLRAMKRHNGNITEAARELGLTRASLYRRLEKHGI